MGVRERARFWYAGMKVFFRYGVVPAIEQYEILDAMEWLADKGLRAVYSVVSGLDDLTTLLFPESNGNMKKTRRMLVPKKKELDSFL